ncbi:MAG: TIGR02099 family protein [Azoarcus sp.]|nr:TIGR02099 family protein [Azoarcus sp.]
MKTEDPEFSFLAGMPARQHSGQRFAFWRSVRQSAVLRHLPRVLGWLSLTACIVCAILYGVMRLWLFPWLGENREWVAEKLSNASGASVSIDRLEADWDGPRPRLRLNGLTIRSEERDALRLERVETTLSWTSLLRWMPYFDALEIVGPKIELGRGKDGVFSVAGIRMEPGSQTGNPIAWLFEQSRIVVRDATLVWNDGLRGAPPLPLTEVQFTFERGLFSHHLEFQARPPEKLASQFEVRGDMRRHGSALLEGIAGNLYVWLEHADLGDWAAWVDYPVPAKGRGRVRLWLDSDGKGTAGLSADLALEEVETTLAPDLVPLRFDQASGRVQARYTPKSVEFSARELWLKSSEVNLHAPLDFRLALKRGADGSLSGGELSASPLDLETFIRLSESMPLDKAGDVRKLLDEFNPKGHLRTFSLEWEGGAGAALGWKVDTEFEGISLAARNLIPGMGNMSGRIKGNNQEGEYVLFGKDGHVDLPRVFEQARVPFESLDASGGWNHRSGRLAVTLHAIKVVNEDAAAQAAGSYWPAEGGGPGEIDLTGEVDRAQGAAVWRYIPIIAGKQVRDWLKRAITQASVTSAKVKLKGPLRHFPFRGGQGEFLVAVRANDARLDYAEGWPALERLNGELRFKGPGLSIESQGGNLFGVRVEPIRVEIPDLSKGIMNIEGAADGPSADFLRFIAESPLAGRLHGFTEPLRPEGNGQLNLKLVMPLRELSETKVAGEYRFAANRVRLNALAAGPALEAAEGSLSFTEAALEALSVRGSLLGGECAVKGKTVAGGLELDARGQLAARAAHEAFGQPVLGWLSGSASWRAEMLFGQNSGKVIVRSELKDLASRLPAPFAKEAGEAWPLEITVASSGDSGSRQITATLHPGLEAALELDASGALRGGIGLNRPAPRSSSNGVQVAASFDTLDVDAWQWSLAAGEGSAQSEEAPLPLASVMLDARKVRAFGYTFSGMKLRAANNAESWTAHLDSAEAQGVVSWKRGGDGILLARLSRLALSGDASNPESDDQGSGVSSPAPPPRGLPGLDVRAEEFAVGARELGQLEVRATNQEGVWRLDSFSIRHPDAQFSGSGLWQPDARHSMLDFTLDVTDVGRFASALGYSNVVQGGQAKLGGKVSWQGPPTQIDYPTLAGQIELNARKGRFERIEPGIGRLLGVLSLQALPRRVTLDFRDVFSDGFVFDRIDAKATVSGGVMHSDSIEIAGPAAKVLMQGQTDIAAETQDLQVTVRPTLSESVAIGAAIVNPVAGAVTYLAQKTLGDPFERLFSYDYKITGSWANPTVEKTGSAAPAPGENGSGATSPANEIQGEPNAG